MTWELVVFLLGLSTQGVCIFLFGAKKQKDDQMEALKADLQRQIDIFAKEYEVIRKQAADTQRMLSETKLAQGLRAHR